MILFLLPPVQKGVQRICNILASQIKKKNTTKKNMG